MTKVLRFPPFVNLKLQRHQILPVSPTQYDSKIHFIPPGVGSVQDLSPHRNFQWNLQWNPDQGSDDWLESNTRPWTADMKSGEAMRELRVAEFQGGRRAAIRALEQLGWVNPSALSQKNAGNTREEQGPVGRNPDRSPRWPTGFVGSISHSRRWIWAVAARANQMDSIGIDTEILLSPTQAEELKSVVGTPIEWDLMEQAGFSWPQAVTLLFSAKEAFFKCWFPQTRTFWEFADVELWSVKSYLKAGQINSSEPTSRQLADGHLQISSRNQHLASNQNLAFPPSSVVLFQIRQPDVSTITWLPRAKPA